MSDWRERMRASYPDHLNVHGGDATNFHFSVKRLTLKSGSAIEFAPASVTAVVGGNNAGKSTVLGELTALINHRSGYPIPAAVSVASVDLVRSGTSSDLVEWVGNNYNYINDPMSPGFQSLFGQREQPGVLASNWEDANSPGVGPASPFLLFYGNAQGRFNIGGSAEMRDSVSDPATHPVHRLQDERPLLDRLSSISSRIFGKPLTLDRLARSLRLRVGEIDKPVPRLDEIDEDYRKAMAALAPLDEQGDGMRSLMGQVIPLITATYPVIVIDEPEAFLHPPQAHALGVELGRLSVERHVQVIVATHDRSFLTGLLSSGVDVSVVRLERDDAAPVASQLDSEKLRELWHDPVLKYTNVLDGLFHRMVVLAEAEGDCAYLGAALDCEREHQVPKNEILFVPTSGKSGMAKVARALRAARVPVVAAPDLDMLSDQHSLKNLVEALEGQWTDEHSTLWQRATSDIRSTREAAKVSHVLDAVHSALDSERDAPYTSEHKEEVLALLRAKSIWGDVKAYGVAAFKGTARQDITLLLDKLDDIGLVMVRDGELERLAPEIPIRKGPEWLEAALRASAQCNVQSQQHLDRILKAGGVLG